MTPVGSNGDVPDRLDTSEAIAMLLSGMSRDKTVLESQVPRPVTWKPQAVARHFANKVTQHVRYNESGNDNDGL